MGVNKLLLSIVILETAVSISCNTAANSKSSKFITWSDSSSVMSYINNTDLCDQIRLVRDSARVFIADHSFAYKVLENISEKARVEIRVPIALEGASSAEEVRIAMIREQMDEVEAQFCKKHRR